MTSSSILSSVEDAISRGWSVFPLKRDDKVPYPGISWDDYNLPLDQWPTDATGYGINCGRSGLTVIDIDDEASFDALLDECRIDDYPNTYTVRTQGGGLHLYFAATRYRNSASKIAQHVDIRGDGGYVVGAGSVVNGKAYEIENNSPVAGLPVWLTYELAGHEIQRQSESWYKLALDDLAAEVETATRGTRNETLNLCAFVAYSNDRIEDNDATERLRQAALATGLQGTEINATLRSAQNAAQRKRAERTDSEPTAALARVQRSTGSDLVKRPTGIVATVTDTWEPTDVAKWFSADQVIIEPTIGKRDDGVYLLYPGRTHSVVAESEAGKSWLALYWCAEQIKAGNDVLYIDCEDDIDGILTRLTDIADEDEIQEHFTYVRPWGPLPDDVAVRFKDKSLVIVDGIGEVLSMHGLKDDADGYLWLDGHLMRALAATGAAVVSLDHVPKAKDNQDSAIGTVHKVNAITGASYILRNVQPFGLGQTGYSRLYVRKDRPGYIRKECVDGGSRELAAELHIISDDPNIATTVKLKTPSPIAKANEYSVREQISNYTFGILPEGASKNEIARSVKGDRNAILKAVNEMERDGYLENIGTANRPRYKHVRQWKAPF